jgi:hypothetical protein
MWLGMEDMDLINKHTSGKVVRPTLRVGRAKPKRDTLGLIERATKKDRRVASSCLAKLARSHHLLTTKQNFKTLFNTFCKSVPTKFFHIILWTPIILVYLYRLIAP